MKNKKKLALLCNILVFVLSAIYLFVPWIGGFNWLAWLVAILNLIAGPAVLFAYIHEVRKGVFRDDTAIAEEVDS